MDKNLYTCIKKISKSGRFAQGINQYSGNIHGRDYNFSAFWIRPIREIHFCL